MRIKSNTLQIALILKYCHHLQKINWHTLWKASSFCWSIGTPISSYTPKILVEYLFQCKKLSCIYDGTAQLLLEGQLQNRYNLEPVFPIHHLFFWLWPLNFTAVRNLAINLLHWQMTSKKPQRKQFVRLHYFTSK